MKEQALSKHVPDTLQSAGMQVLGVKVQWQMPALAREADIPVAADETLVAGHLGLVWAEAKPEGSSL